MGLFDYSDENLIEQFSEGLITLKQCSDSLKKAESVTALKDAAVGRFMGLYDTNMDRLKRIGDANTEIDFHCKVVESLQSNVKLIQASFDETLLELAELRKFYKG